MRKRGLYYRLLDHQKRKILRRAVEEAGGNRTRAAAFLQIQRTYLLLLVRKLNMTLPPPHTKRRN